MPESLISFNLCALIIASSFLIIFLIRQPLMIFRERVYLNIAITTVLTDISAVAASYALIKSPTALLVFRTVTASLLFYTMVLWPLYFASLFNFKIRLKTVGPVIITSVILIAFMAVINFFTESLFYIDESLVYIETPLFKAIYSASFAACFITSTCIFIPARLYTSFENLFLYAFILLSCSGALIVDIIYPNEEVLQLAIAISIVSIYFTMPVPESYVDSMTGLLNEEAFNKLCSKRIGSQKKTYCVAVCLHDAKSLTAIVQRDRTDLVSHICKKNFGKALKNTLIFKFFPGGYIIVLNKEDEEYANLVLQKALDFVKDFRTGPSKTGRNNATVSLICCPEEASSTEEIKAFLHHILNKGIEENLSLVKEQDLPVHDIRFVFKTQRLLSNAEEEGRLKVLFQPIYSIKTNSFDTAEALLRLKDENDSFIVPSVFIPLAERNGSIFELEDFMIDEVCRTFSEHHLASLGLQNIGINLSPVECIQDGLKENISSILKKYSLPKSCISIEITETATGHAGESFAANISALEKDGYTICLDNLGTGNSSLTRLMSIPFSLIKIDKSIVIPAFSGGEKERIIFDSILEISRYANAKSVIQGIETESGAERAALLNADYIQGYYFSKPLTEDEFVDFLQEHRNKNARKEKE